MDTGPGKKDYSNSFWWDFAASALRDFALQHGDVDAHRS